MRLKLKGPRQESALNFSHMFRWGSMVSSSRLTRLDAEYSRIRREISSGKGTSRLQDDLNPFFVLAALPIASVHKRKTRN